MSQTNLEKHNLRSALLLGAASIAMASISLPALAQQDQGQTETVIVTGSRIPQQGLYSASPVTAINQQELKFEGTTDVTNVLNNLPSIFVDQNNGVANGASGTANVDLRGLGPKRTLVLIDGTRLMPGDIADPVADLNDIPAALVDHVEVLTGGASAVYGSDALAGVVNFIMRKDFDGIELDGTYSGYEADNTNSTWRGILQDNISSGGYGFTEPGQHIFNGQTSDATLIMGTNTANGKGNITVYLGYRNTAPILEATRDFAGCTIQSTGAGASCQGSSNFNRWLSFDNGVAGSFSAYPYDFFQVGTGKSGSGTFTPYTGAGNQHFNFGALNYFQRPDTRYSGGFFAHYQVNKELDVYSSFMFSDDHTVAQIAQSGLFLGSGTASSGTVLVNCSNPLMTPQENQQLCGLLEGDTLVTSGSRPYWDGAANLVPFQSEDLIGRRNIEGGFRADDLRHTAYRMKIGAKGELGDGWSYDIYAQYGLTLFTENYQGELSKARVQNALEVDPATGQCYAAENGFGNSAATDPGCVPLDIFNGLGSITPAMEQYVSAVGLQEGWTQEQIISGVITGDLAKWGGQLPWAENPIQVSLGVEYRQEELKLLTDHEFSTNDLYGQGAATLSVPQSGFDVKEVFTELKVPLVQNKPYFEDLSLNGGYRYSSYNISGATNTYKYGLEWQPIDDFRIRASVQRASRAPNVVELFAPPNVKLFSGQDPCAGATGVVLTNCVNQGVPFAGTGLLTCPATQCNNQVSGNVQLKPEVSDTRTIGFVFQPTFIDGFNATVDWFDIDVKDYISTLGAQFILNECYGVNANSSSQAYFCPFVHRNGAGLIFGNGYVSNQTLNTGSLSTKGVDFEINYQTSSDDWGMPGWGSLTANLVGTWLNTLTIQPVPVNAQTTAGGLIQPFNCAGLYGLTCDGLAGNGDGGPDPKWRHKLRVTWSSPWDVDLSFQWRYVGAVALDADSSNSLLNPQASNVVTCPNGLQINGGPFDPNAGVVGGDCWDARISSYSYFDLAATWTVRSGVTLTGGVNNIVGTEPPVIGTSALPLPFGNGNTFPGTYDAFGRMLFVNATIKY